MRKYHICLKASTFPFSKLIKKLLEDILFTFPYFEAQIKSRGFSFRQEKEGKLRGNHKSIFHKGRPTDVLSEPTNPLTQNCET